MNGSVGESAYSLWAPNVNPAKTYTFHGSGITSVTFYGNGHNFAAFGGPFIDDIVVTSEGCQVDGVTNFFQGPCPALPDAPWGCGDYAGSGDHISAKGCTLTALAMALKFAGVTTIPGTGEAMDPGSLNRYMIANDLFSRDSDPKLNNNVKLDETAGYISEGSGKPLKLKYDSQFGLTSKEALDEMLCKGYPVIVQVQGTHGPHYILATGKQDNTYSIIDPGARGNSTLESYGNTFNEIRGYIADPQGDVSRFDINVGSSAELFVEDASGKLTGLDKSTGTVLKEIPHSTHFVDELADDETGALPSGSSHSVLIFQPSPGIYWINLLGIASGQYNLSLTVFSQNGAKQTPIKNHGSIMKDEVQLFMANVSTTNGSQTTVTQILPPVCNAGGPYTVECNGAHTSVKLNGSGSTDPNGSAFTYFWTSDCPAATFDNPASANPMLTLNSSTGPGYCNVTLTVRNTFGLTSGCSTTVTVMDTTPPSLTCPTGVVLEFLNETGAIATFSATATDICSTATITYAPPSGSWFPIGVTPVQVQAIDTSSNTSRCSFNVTVLGARGVKSNVLASAVSLRSTATNVLDRIALDGVITELRRALMPSIWVDETHVVNWNGAWVFGNELAAVAQLQFLNNCRRSSIPTNTVNGLIGRLVKDDRLLAVVNIRNAANAGANSNKVARVLAIVAQGDQLAAKGKPDQAILMYWNAWYQAQFLKKSITPPDVCQAMQLQFAGSPGRMYWVQACMDGVNWFNVSKIKADSAGGVAFTDNNAGNHAPWLYQVVGQ